MDALLISRQLFERFMTFQETDALRARPDESGCFGAFGGRFGPETLMPLIVEPEIAYAEARKDAVFQKNPEPAYQLYLSSQPSIFCAAHERARTPDLLQARRDGTRTEAKGLKPRLEHEY